MNVRRASDGDLAAVRPLLEQLMQAETDRSQTIWSEAVRREGYFAWVAESDGTPVGFVDLFVLPDVSHGRSIGLINNLVVDRRVRRQGVGEVLLQEAVRLCRRQNVVEVHVWTDFGNAPAIGLYRKLGFVDRALLLELELK